MKQQEGTTEQQAGLAKEVRAEEQRRQESNAPTSQPENAPSSTINLLFFATPTKHLRLNEISTERAEDTRIDHAQRGATI